VIGYAFYSCLFAASVALVSRSEELQNTTTPLTVVILGSFFGAIYALGNPESGLARLISLLPPSAPLTMPVRITVGVAEPWEILLSLILSVAAILGLVRVAARLYEGAILRTGGAVKVREAWAAGR
jgi:ABC-2 type transport system permease protein